MEFKLAMLIADHKKEVREIQRKTFFYAVELMLKLENKGKNSILCFLEKI